MWEQRTGWPSYQGQVEMLACLYPELSVKAMVCLVCATPLNCEETMTPWCEAELMSSEHWRDQRRRYHRRQFVMVNCCVIAGLNSIGLHRSGCQGEEVLQLIGCLEDFSAKVSGMATLCSMCVYLFCWQLPRAQIAAHHIRSFCLSCPAQKDSFTPSSYCSRQWLAVGPGH